MTVSKMIELIISFPSIVLEEVVDTGKRIWRDEKEMVNGEYTQIEDDE